MTTELIKAQQKKASFFIIAVIMWEFFSFYGLKAILLLYFTSQLHFSDAVAYQLFGSFISLVFITPILGGWLADRFCGYRYATAMGCILIVVGHLMLTCVAHNIFIGLSLLTMGIGFFKSNAVCLISNCYPDDSVGAVSAFSWYYVSGNLGAVVAQIVCPYLVEKISWNVGFIMAAFGMMLGFITLLLSKPYFSWEKQTEKMGNWQSLSGFKKLLATGAVISVTFLLTYFMLRHNLVGYLLMAAVIAAVIIFVRIYQNTTEERQQSLLMMVILAAFATAFWVFSNQVSSSYPLFILRYVNRDLLGFMVPTGMFQALNPAAVLTAGTVMGFLWRWMGRRNIRPEPDTKLSMALLLLMLGFLVITYASKLAGIQGHISIFLPALSVILLGIAEVFIDPVLLAALGDIAPLNTEGRLVAIYYLFLGSVGNYLSIWVSKLTVDPSTSTATARTYHDAYLQVAYVAIVLFGLLLLKILWRKKNQRQLAA